MVVAVVIRSRVSNSLNGILHDTAATGAACVDVREAVLYQFIDAAPVEGHGRKGP
jgi:hypothetical protein